MTNAYDRAYLLHARQTLGRMLDFSCHVFGYSARGFWDLFLASGVAASFGEGDAHFIAGMSGYELAYEVFERCGVKFSRVVDPSPSDGKSPEFWAAWSLAHYQWFRGLSFSSISRDGHLAVLRRDGQALPAEISRTESAAHSAPRQLEPTRAFRTLRRVGKDDTGT